LKKYSYLPDDILKNPKLVLALLNVSREGAEYSVQDQQYANDRD
jgi:hypothetical protein